MRRWISAILAAMLLLSLTACGSTNSISAPEEHSDATQIQQSGDQGAETVETSPQEPANKTEVFAITKSSVYVSYDASLRTKSHGYYLLAYDTDDALTGIIYDGAHEFTGDLAGVANYFSSLFPKAAYYSSRGYLEGSQIEVLESEPCTVNGFDSIRFTGRCLNDGEWYCHVYGYSFIINDTAVAIIGLVSAQEQDPEMIATIDARVDAMAATVRTEK